MNDHIVLETTKEIDGTQYTVRSYLPSKKDIETYKNKLKKLILTDIKNKETEQKNIRLIT